MTRAPLPVHQMRAMSQSGRHGRCAVLAGQRRRPYSRGGQLPAGRTGRGTLTSLAMSPGYGGSWVPGGLAADGIPQSRSSTARLPRAAVWRDRTATSSCPLIRPRSCRSSGRRDTRNVGRSPFARRSAAAALRGYSWCARLASLASTPAPARLHPGAGASHPSLDGLSRQAPRPLRVAVRTRPLSITGRPVPYLDLCRAKNRGRLC